MSRDTLYLLAPGFLSEGRREYCPECAELWGVLSYYPSIKDSAEIVHVPIDKPRAVMAARLGDKNQNAPTLVLHDDSPSFEDCGIMTWRGQRFINNARDIGLYWAARYGTAKPRGHHRP